MNAVPCSPERHRLVEPYTDAVKGQEADFGSRRRHWQQQAHRDARYAPLLGDGCMGSNVLRLPTGPTCARTLPAADTDRRNRWLNLVAFRARPSLLRPVPAEV